MAVGHQHTAGEFLAWLVEITHCLVICLPLCLHEREKDLQKDRTEKRICVELFLNGLLIHTGVVTARLKKKQKKNGWLHT